MNIQIFGRSKCFDTKKAERYFKERRIKVQMIDLLRYGISPGELRSVKQAVGGYSALIGPKADPLLQYLGSEADLERHLLEEPENLRTPIVRNGKKATVGYCPEIWQSWE